MENFNDLLRKKSINILVLIQQRRETVVCVHIWGHFLEYRLSRQVTKNARCEEGYNAIRNCRYWIILHNLPGSVLACDAIAFTCNP